MALPERFENPVAAMFGVDLRKHHELGGGDVLAPHLSQLRGEPVALVFVQRQQQRAIGIAGALRLQQGLQVDAVQFWRPPGRGVVAPMAGVEGAGGADGLPHGVVQARQQGGVPQAIGVRGSQTPSVQSFHFVHRQPAAAQDLRGFAAPGGGHALSGRHPELAAGCIVGGGLLDMQELRDFVPLLRVQLAALSKTDGVEPMAGELSVRVGGADSQRRQRGLQQVGAVLRGLGSGAVGQPGGTRIIPSLPRRLKKRSVQRWLHGVSGGGRLPAIWVRGGGGDGVAAIWEVPKKAPRTLGRWERGAF